MIKLGYSELAHLFAEKYGVVQYKVQKNLMIYYVSYPAYLSNSRYTVKYIVNLDTYQTESQVMKKYMKCGEYNR